MKGTLLDKFLKVGVRGHRTKLLDAELPRLDNPADERAHAVGAYYLPRDSRIEKAERRFHPAEKQNTLKAGK
jgi:hypothetical protein